MMNAWDAVLSHVARRISDVAGTTVEPTELVLPPTFELGDLAYGCFKAAKALGKNPAELAKELAAKLSEKDVTIESASAAGPYLNIRLSVSGLLPRLLSDAKEQGENYGQTDARADQTFLFEYANPNTHKEIHVGHLRNFILGAALVRILRRSGAQVIPVSYINDIGTHVAKCLWYLVSSLGFEVRQFEMKDVEVLIDKVPLEQRNARYLGQIYTEATRKLDSVYISPVLDGEISDESRRHYQKEAENHAQFIKEAELDVSFVHNALESHDPVWEALWKETKRWCMDEMSSIFDELGVRIERQYFDSECVDRAHVMLEDLEKRGVAVKSEGALIINMEEQKLGVMLLRKSDGSLLYAAKDLALAELKAKEYPTFTESIVLVDVRQSLNFRQLAEALKRMDYTRPYGFLGYELVTLPEGAMSSRKGNIVTFHAFRDAVREQAQKTTLERHEDWNEGKLEYTSWCLAIAGMKYATLKQDPEKPIVFDIKAALSFDGDTGPYIQYAATRLGSILKKADFKSGIQKDLDFSGITEPTERALAVRIAQLPDICRRASREMKPSVIAQWCFAMAQDVNAFYRDVKVLEAPFGVKQARLQLVWLARHALVHGLDVIGIPVPEEM